MIAIPQVTVQDMGMFGFCIKDDEDGERFRNARNEIRLYSRPGGATAFLRRTNYPWIAKMPSGRTLYINCENPATAKKLGPHFWRKKNVVTIIDASGVYDVWKCTDCGEEVKRFGLSGQPHGGHCKKNPIEEVGE